MRTIWKIFKTLVWIIYFSPLVIGLLMIATGHGSESSDSPTTNSPNSVPYTSPSDYTPTYSISVQQTEPMRYKRGVKTPDDAYNEGYSDGYEQGNEDGRNGYSHGANYDNSSNYYDYYETMYQKGYESGYEDGYSEGESQHEDEEESEDDE